MSPAVQPRDAGVAPLTAIRGYASSLLQPDVTWDGESQHRFIARIAAESARLGRLVDDLVTEAEWAIEAGLMKRPSEDLRKLFRGLIDVQFRRRRHRFDAAEGRFLRSM